MAHRIPKEALTCPDLHKMEDVRSFPTHETHEVVWMMLEEALLMFNMTA